MSNTITFPAEGIVQLVIDEMARDGIARGAADATQIQVAYEPFERATAPSFVLEDSTVRFTGAAAYRIHLPEGVGLAIGRARGDLRLQELSGAVNLAACRGDLRLDSLSDAVTIGEADGDLRAEGVADLRITGTCHGDLRFEAGGALAVEALSGDLRLGAASELRLGRIHGDLWAEKVTGDVYVERSEGDVRLSEIGGMATLGALSGDLRATGLGGGLTAQVRGDVLLSGPFTAAGGYSVAADGDALLQLPADADLGLTARAHGRIRSDVPLTPAADGSPTFTAILGKGSGRVSLVAGGDVRITQAGAAAAGRSWERRGRGGGDPFADLNTLGDRIRQQVSASLASAGINIETGEINLGRTKSSFRPPRPPAPPTPPGVPPASADEQLAILKMVEEGKITPEEADVLLRALGA